MSSRVLRERPSNAASINILRSVGKRVASRGFEGIDEYLRGLRASILSACRESAEIASNRVVDGDVILTNSNSACMKYMFKQLVDSGTSFEVIVAESRPGMEGLDLASYLDELGVETYLIVDSAMRFFAKRASKVFVSSESLAINGAVVSKVGTSLLCLIAKESRLRVFALAPLYKLSFETIYGELLELPKTDLEPPVHERGAGRELSAEAARVPLFDVAPPEYIDAIATEHGLYAPQAIPAVLRQVYGSYPPPVEPLNEVIDLVRRKYGGSQWKFREK